MVTGNYFFIKIVPFSIFLNKSAIYTEIEKGEIRGILIYVIFRTRGMQEYILMSITALEWR
jgi:hypothetical protein